MQIIATTRNNSDARRLAGSRVAGVKCKHNGGKTLIFDCVPQDALPMLLDRLEEMPEISEYVDPTLPRPEETQPHNDPPTEEPAPPTVRNTGTPSNGNTVVIVGNPLSDLLVVISPAGAVLFSAHYYHEDGLIADVMHAMRESSLDPWDYSSDYAERTGPDDLPLTIKRALQACQGFVVLRGPGDATAFGDLSVRPAADFVAEFDKAWGRA